jgi:hypothetical protein
MDYDMDNNEMNENHHEYGGKDPNEMEQIEQMRRERYSKYCFN